MARIAAGIPHHITQRGNRRHVSGNEYGVPGISKSSQGSLVLADMLTSLTPHPGVFENAFLGTIEIALARVRALGPLPRTAK